MTTTARTPCHLILHFRHNFRSYICLFTIITRYLCYVITPLVTGHGDDQVMFSVSKCRSSHCAYSRWSDCSSSSLPLYCFARPSMTDLSYGGFEEWQRRLSRQHHTSARCLLRAQYTSTLLPLPAVHTPARFVSSAGSTSLTVRSTSTPPIMRKHLRSGEALSVSRRVSMTALCEDGIGG